ncbi:MAG TPA: hypothetical protein PLU35_01250 [Phycisphaerales bacterium]|nr:hypothetical protein [Phycisphaerales bacterium]
MKLRSLQDGKCQLVTDAGEPLSPPLTKQEAEKRLEILRREREYVDRERSRRRTSNAG